MQKILYQTDQNNPAIQAYKEAVEKGKNDQHIFPLDSGWIVKSLLSDRINKKFDNQQEAIKYAESHAVAGTAIFIHSQNGLIDRTITSS